MALEARCPGGRGHARYNKSSRQMLLSSVAPTLLEAVVGTHVDYSIVGRRVDVNDTLRIQCDTGSIVGMPLSYGQGAAFAAHNRLETRLLRSL
jgi:hypothetical protein